MTTCTNCQNKLDEGDHFCPKCGKAVNSHNVLELIEWLKCIACALMAGVLGYHWIAFGYLPTLYVILMVTSGAAAFFLFVNLTGALKNN